MTFLSKALEAFELYKQIKKHKTDYQDSMIVCLEAAKQRKQRNAMIIY